MSTTASATASSIKYINGFPVPDFSDERNAPQQNKNEKVCPPAPRKPRPTSSLRSNYKRVRTLSFD